MGREARHAVHQPSRRPGRLPGFDARSGCDGDAPNAVWRLLRPHQRVDVMTALKAMTMWPAWQHFVDDGKGSVEIGKLADFVLLSGDPTAIDPEDLHTLRVMATIKENKLICEAEAGEDKGQILPGMYPDYFPSGNHPHGGHAFLDLVPAGNQAMTE